jgi:hypothetical protein
MFLGLADTRQIGRILIQPTNPDMVLVATLGHAFGPNDERGDFFALLLTLQLPDWVGHLQVH